MALQQGLWLWTEATELQENTGLERKWLAFCGNQHEEGHLGNGQVMGLWCK